MLKRLKMYSSHHLQAVGTSCRGLRQKPMATLMIALVIGITLTLPTLFWLFTHNLEQLTNNWQRTGRISLYLKLSTSVKEQTTTFLRVKAMSGVGHAELRSPDEGLKELQLAGLGDVMTYLPENPLPAVIDITPALSLDTPEKIEVLFQALKGLPLVEQAQLDVAWVKQLHAILDFARYVVHGMIVLLALAVTLVIGNTLRLSVHNRYEEIQVLKLVGATDPFIMRPFLYTGILYGMAGAVCALMFATIFMLTLTGVANQLAHAYQMHYPLKGVSFSQGMWLVFCASVLGWLGAKLSVKRQLALIEPYN